MFLARVLVGAGLMALGYYLGREAGRTEPLRRDLERDRPPAATAGGPDGAPGEGPEARAPRG
jgi:hypothetical protein